MNSPTLTDTNCESEIVTEVRRIKRRLSANYGGDFHSMCEASRQHQNLSGHLIVDRRRPAIQRELAHT
jgi:hypothetical protein